MDLFSQTSANNMSGTHVVSSLYAKSELLEVKGYGGYILKSETISKIVSMTVLVILIPMGLEAICWGQMLSNIISVLSAAIL